MTDGGDQNALSFLPDSKPIFIWFPAPRSGRSPRIRRQKGVAVFAANRLTGCSGATLSPEKASQENSISTIQGFPQLLAPGNADLHLSPLHLRNMALGDVRFLRKHFLSHPFPPAHGRNTTAGPSSSRISGKASRHGIELDTFICSTPP